MEGVVVTDQFTTDIRHVSGALNPVADALSRVHTFTCPFPIDLSAMAAAQRSDAEIEQLRQSSSLCIEAVPLPSADGTILSDVSTGVPRPVVPSSFRRTVFDALHNLAHPGIRASVKLITDRFIWPKASTDVCRWAQTCLQCQRSKIHRHTRSPLGAFRTPDARFKHVHIDLVGPLPPSKGHTYILTCIDRFTRWPEAVPLPDCSAETVASAFLERWVSQYGCPTMVTTDRGSHFHDAFSTLLDALGTRHIQTTAYHPASNGLVERFHRQLKAALRAHANPSWKEVFPLILISVRSTVKPDLQSSPSELVYGCTLRLPGELVAPRPPTHVDYGQYVERLRDYMRKLRPATIRPQTAPSYVPPELTTCKFVFLRDDRVRAPLRAPYKGPYRVIRRKDKAFIINQDGKPETVLIDRLKPAFVDEGPVDPPVPSTSKQIPVSDLPQETSTADPTAPDVSGATPSSGHPVRTNRHGREIRQPVRFTEKNGNKGEKKMNVSTADGADEFLLSR